jgi:hypothetical protein
VTAREQWEKSLAACGEWRGVVSDLERATSRLERAVDDSTLRMSDRDALSIALGRLDTERAEALDRMAQLEREADTWWTRVLIEEDDELEGAQVFDGSFGEALHA